MSVKGAVLGGDDILLAEYASSRGPNHFNLPGGRVRQGEALRDALERKIREETGVTAVAGRLLFCLEYVPGHHAGKYGSLHKVQLWFECQAARSQVPVLPDPLDEEREVGAGWYPVADLPRLNLLPPIGSRLVRALGNPLADPLVSRW